MLNILTSNYSIDFCVGICVPSIRKIGHWRERECNKIRECQHYNLKESNRFFFFSLCSLVLLLQRGGDPDALNIGQKTLSLGVSRALTVLIVSLSVNLRGLEVDTVSNCSGRRCKGVATNCKTARLLFRSLVVVF